MLSMLSLSPLGVQHVLALLGLGHEFVQVAKVLEVVECFLVDCLFDFLLFLDWLGGAEHFNFADFDELLVLSLFEFEGPFLFLL